MYPAAEWLVIAALSACVFTYGTYRRFKRGKIKGDLFFWAIFCPTLLFFAILGVAGKYTNTSDKIIKWVNEFFGWAIRTVGLRTTQILIAVLITTLGFLAHHFKKKNQTLYGRVEMVVGFLTAWFVAGTLTPGNIDLSKWATLAGAAYVIARGRGNYEDAKGKLIAPKGA